MDKWGTMSAVTRTRRTSTLRALASTTLVLCVGLILAACAEKEDRAAVASAKCTLPVAEEAGFDVEAQHPRKEAVHVEDLGEGSYRVTGRMYGGTEFEQRSVYFTCEVAPDDSDELRGFTVTRVDVTSLEVVPAE